MKKMLPPFLFSLVTMMLFTAFPSSLQAEEAGSYRCAELIDRPDDLCPEYAAMTPLITCPQDVYVSCSHYTGNPSDYGQPVVNGHWQNVQIVEHPAQVFTNQCGIGHVIRTWTIYTQVGNYSCTQRINISGYGSFGYHDIHWPLDYTITNQCQGVPHPNDLPPPYNKPTWNQRACSMIGISYKDDVFYFGDPFGSAGCRKIVRTWKVIDWCQYTPNGNQGLWMKTQIIKLEDKRAPEFVNCPAAFEVGVNNSCDGAIVNFPIPVALDNCNANPRITNNSPYSTLKGADASGFYPLGMHHVRFVADDGCGNFDTCVVKVTVKDLKKPTPICYHGLTANLMQMGDDGFIRIQAKHFDAGSYDNCTPRSRLKFSVEPAEFTCEDRGRNDIRVIVEDESGNTDFCVTYVIIQDNMGMCPPDTTGGLISGLVAFHNDEVMEDVMLYAKQDDAMPSSVTDEAGIYLMDKLVDGKSYEIRPVKSGALNEGISTVDLIMLRQHLNGERLLDNPYKLIAADVNLDKKITVHDLNQLRLIMMAGIQSFPGLTAWRFVDKAYEFEDALNPLNEPFTEVYKIAQHNKTDMKLDFVGIKVGDFDGTCLDKPEDDDEPVIYTQAGSRNASDHAILAEEVRFAGGGTVIVPLVLNEDMEAAGFQFTLSYDTDKLRFVDWTADVAGSFGDLQFSAVDAEKGVLYFSWDNETLHARNAGDLLGNLVFRAVASGYLSEAMSFGKRPLRPQVYDHSLSASPLQLVFGAERNKATGLHWVNVYPNPFSSECQIAFVAPVAGNVEAQVMDINGRIVSRAAFEAIQGNNDWIIKGDQLPGAGVYILSLTFGNETLHRRVVMMD
jgi:hypothetical protein